MSLAHLGADIFPTLPPLPSTRRTLPIVYLRPGDLPTSPSTRRTIACARRSPHPAPPPVACVVSPLRCWRLLTDLRLTRTLAYVVISPRHSAASRLRPLLVASRWLSAQSTSSLALQAGRLRPSSLPLRQIEGGRQEFREGRCQRRVHSTFSVSSSICHVLFWLPSAPRSSVIKIFFGGLAKDTSLATVRHLTTHIGEDESEAPISLSQGNEVEEVDRREMKGRSERPTDIECESSDEEEEYTSDECEDDDEDEIWCVEHDRAPVLGGASVGGFCSRHQLLVLRLSLLRESLHLLNLEDQVQVRCQRMLLVSRGGGNFYESTLREVWINGYSNHRFTRRSDEARSRLVWTMTARSNFKHLLYNARKNVEKVSQSADPTLWRERAPSWMRRDYRETLCNIWAAERWQQTSTIMKVNRAADPEANMHTGGSVSFATHQSRLESYIQQMTEKYAG
ncbi:hypothetical protein Taro_000123 [Colocasia esculenta]|uniref:Uncharacterized protein n=1 Tax=Colocasia esculenta TaxID=4460 RepID=A0A843TC21_COLES|nr:hypothetical protein [Colocasia esculenta]